LLRDHRPEAIVRNLVGEGLHLFGHDFAYRFFEAGGPGASVSSLSSCTTRSWLVVAAYALRERAARMDSNSKNKKMIPIRLTDKSPGER
jgi:hypothetical protein